VRLRSSGRHLQYLQVIVVVAVHAVSLVCGCGHLCLGYLKASTCLLRAGATGCQARACTGAHARAEAARGSTGGTEPAGAFTCAALPAGPTRCAVPRGAARWRSGNGRASDPGRGAGPARRVSTAGGLFSACRAAFGHRSIAVLNCELPDERKLADKAHLRYDEYR
jgi:hypothetical protein